MESCSMHRQEAVSPNGLYWLVLCSFVHRFAATSMVISTDSIQPFHPPENLRFSGESAVVVHPLRGVSRPAIDATAYLPAVGNRTSFRRRSGGQPPIGHSPCTSLGSYLLPGRTGTGACHPMVCNPLCAPPPTPSWGMGFRSLLRSVDFAVDLKHR